jgi:hypothetical protein
MKETLIPGLEEVIALNWRKLPVGSKDVLLERLDTVNTYLEANKRYIDLASEMMLSMPISMETVQERSDYIMAQARYHEATRAKWTLEKELHRRGGI